jgi:hypothetical protein
MLSAESEETDFITFPLKEEEGAKAEAEARIARNAEMTFMIDNDARIIKSVISK